MKRRSWSITRSDHLLMMKMIGFMKDRWIILVNLMDLEDLSLRMRLLLKVISKAKFLKEISATTSQMGGLGWSKNQVTLLGGLKINSPLATASLCNSRAITDMKAGSKTTCQLDHLTSTTRSSSIAMKILILENLNDHYRRKKNLFKKGHLYFKL